MGGACCAGSSTAAAAYAGSAAVLVLLACWCVSLAVPLLEEPPPPQAASSRTSGRSRARRRIGFPGYAMSGGPDSADRPGSGRVADVRVGGVARPHLAPRGLQG